ncbi:MAG: sigma-70 family RNA polymerase sigma factor [Clostridia bacterium]|nr:sigma-70 family RNA polymerase sigma factor [Clostridia bacterium]
MLNRKSIYAINKKDPDAIVYIDAEGNTIRLTRADFASEEEFAKWKEWSDAEYHDTDNRDSRYGRETVSLEWTAERETATPAVDYIYGMDPDTKDTDPLHCIKDAITKSNMTAVQRKRVWLYYVERKKEQEIAQMEGVSVQAVSRSIKKAMEVLKKYL